MKTSKGRVGTELGIDATLFTLKFYICRHKYSLEFTFILWSVFPRLQKNKYLINIPWVLLNNPDFCRNGLTLNSKDQGRPCVCERGQQTSKGKITFTISYLGKTLMQDWGLKIWMFSVDKYEVKNWCLREQWTITGSQRAVAVLVWGKGCRETAISKWSCQQREKAEVRGVILSV